MTKRISFILLSISWIIGFVTVFQWKLHDRVGNENSPLVNNARKVMPVATVTKQTCEPKRKIGFLKMHKCASTTVQNIFLRHAHTKDLNVILPLGRSNYLGSPELFSLELVNGTPWHHLGYDIMALHTRWHQSTIKQALGGDPTFITTIREPAQLFESLYGYYNLYKFHGELTLYEFLDKLEDEDFKRKDDRFLQKIGRNQMLFDLGFPIEDFDNEEKVKKFVDEVEQNFDLVMVTEKMEESIVLLKHLLCWDYRDLVFLKRNSRAKNKIQKLSVDQTNKLRRWLKADNYLYTKLREVFDKKVEKFGYKKMEEEKQKLSSVMNQIMEGCLSGEKNLQGKILFEELKKSAGCRLYALGEHIFLDEIKKAQWKRADKVALQSLGLR
ncbi:galactosylceramide sulfotransferase-like [Artemia franciscana]|uniref:galactosylceramide sulfotransferase-like n=1 Tax=Artemia franciscana TaxID=6661 RepID=UPI0032DA6A70